MEKGARVKVFENSITCEKLEGLATVTKVLLRHDWTDVFGNPVARCNVRFDKTRDGYYDRSSYERDVSQAA